MHSYPWYLVLTLLPFVYLLGVLVAVSAGVAFNAFVKRGRAGLMDEDQMRAFGTLRPGWLARLRGLWIESLCQAIAFFLQSVHTVRLLPLPPPRASGTPVIVLPGYSENAGSMWRLAKRLEAAGFNPVLIDFPSTTRPIEANARYLGERIAEIRARHGGAEVAVVAHSMGGLVTRTWIHSAEDHGVQALVAIASPFRGTQLAALSALLPLGRSAAQMAPRHGFFTSYPPSLACPVPLLSLVARQETIVTPEWSVVIAGAEVRVLDHAYGHVAPLFVASAFVEIETFLLAKGVTRALKAEAASALT